MYFVRENRMHDKATDLSVHYWLILLHLKYIMYVTNNVLGYARSGHLGQNGF